MFFDVFLVFAFWLLCFFLFLVSGFCGLFGFWFLAFVFFLFLVSGF